MARFDDDPAKIAAMRVRLLGWYAQHQRNLPWRQSSDPYAIWVSEIMLQQTRAAVVAVRYQEFMERFPTLIALALAPEQDVLALWSGLGYYRRARMLHKAAQFVAAHLGGNLPARAEELRALPGIGAYTAAAVASIAHGEPVAVVDGNVERVLCRLAGWEAGSRKGGGATLRHKIENLARRLLDRARPGDFNQAIMELGATVCAPRNPQCAVCPLLADCRMRGEHKTPRRTPMISRAVGYALSVRTETASKKRHGPGGREVLLEQRPAQQTVMPGMWELPMLVRSDVPEKDLRMTVRHAIMQVNYYVRIRTVFEDDIAGMTVAGGERRWVPLREAAGMALTGLARKVLSRAHLLPAPPLDSFAPSAGKDVKSAAEHERTTRRG
ncbi:MAG TPA: A/G-specific adenine glycosylase [Terracidiphilus sp.]|nr:A/G-specific adenine glycosylase [Terracidiphilus sp.]